MENNEAEEAIFQANKKEKKYTLKIIKNLGNSKYEFKIDNSLKIYMKGKKKVFYFDKDGNKEYEIYVFNDEQLFQFQNYLIKKKLIKIYIFSMVPTN